MPETVFLCFSTDLVEKSVAVPYDVLYNGLVTRAFAIRYHQNAYSYLNLCGHLGIEMDLLENQFWDT
ncbi:MAG: Rieske (2Fe-2S) protein, partial [Gammaproteobacteria bacterium]|nr:Rieske (2Fe-2S) protein [Gammaproteobacteria bacterium]